MGGPGFTDFDALSAVQAWVEAAKAPDLIVASKSSSMVSTSGVQSTRPLCAYPKSARYTGSGSPDDAASFTCVARKNSNETAQSAAQGGRL
jgi:feruloyl esterase